MNKCIISIVLVWFMLFQVGHLRACNIDSDCGEGFACQEIQDWDDFGCKAEQQIWMPDDTTSSASAIGGTRSNNSTTATTTSTVNTNSRIQQSAATNAEAGNAPAGSNRPSRLIIRTQNDQRAVLRFEQTTDANNFFALALNPTDGNLRLTQADKTIMRVNQEGTIIDCTNDVTIRASSIEINDYWTIADQQLSFNGVPQWKLVLDEVFRVGNTAEGWSLPEAVSQCGALHMLGGYCQTSSETLTRTVDRLPVHNRIRIQATFHFIDAWSGDTAYLRVSTGDDIQNLDYIWTDSYDYVSTHNAFNIWGRESIGEDRFTTNIDVEMLHTSDRIRLRFGTSLGEDNWEASYGISSLKISVI